VRKWLSVFKWPVAPSLPHRCGLFGAVWRIALAFNSGRYMGQIATAVVVVESGGG